VILLVSLTRIIDVPHLARVYRLFRATI